MSLTLFYQLITNYLLIFVRKVRNLIRDLHIVEAVSIRLDPAGLLLEVRCRAEELDSGTIRVVPSEEVMRKARKLL